MKKFLLVTVVVIGLFVIAGTIFAGRSPVNNPIDSLRDAVNELQTKVAALFGDVSGLQSKVSIIAPSVKQLQKDVNNLQSQVNAIVSLPASRPSAFKAYVRIEPIKGDSNDPEHKDWIQAISFSWGVSNPNSGSPGGGGSDSPAFTDFEIVHKMDLSSPKLALAVCNGQHIKEVILDLCQPDNGRIFMEYRFEDVILTSLNPAGEVKSGEIPMEQFGFTYRRVEWRYYPADGSPVLADWDLITNKS